MVPWLARIVLQAASLAERIKAASAQPATEPELDSAAEDRWHRWCRSVGGQGEKTLQARLQALGVDEAAGRRALVDAAWDFLLPEWAVWLQQIVAAGKDFRWEKRPSAPDSAPIADAASRPGARLPFEEFFTPCLQVARSALRSELAKFPEWETGSRERISPTVWPALEHALLVELVELAWRTLFAGFSETRPIGETLLRDFGATSYDEPGDNDYREFIESLWRDGGIAWFQAYPALARLLATRVQFWVESHAVMLRRLQADWTEVVATFAAASIAAVRLVAVTEGLSDFHHRGQSVVILHFGDGFRCVYKPKPLCLSKHYNRFLDWCNQGRGSAHETLSLKTLATIDRGEYGWSEFVAAGECRDQAGLRRFHRRAGQLVCVAQVLCGVDFHFENVIAAGEDPVLIDVEALLHPLFMAESRHAPFSAHAINERFSISAVHTSLLPRWKFDAEENVAFDMSGLASFGPGEFRRRVRQWSDLNTDAMRLEYVHSTELRGKNLPGLAGKSPAAGEWLEDCLFGYRAIHGFLRKMRADLLESAVWNGFQGQPVRFLFRNTMVYGRLLRKTLEPNYLRSGVERSLEFESLMRGVYALRGGEPFWPLIEAEIASLEQGDVPFFLTQSTTSAIAHEGKIILESTGYQPPFEAATRRLQGLDDVDLAWQCDIIRGTVHARMIGNISAQPPSKKPVCFEPGRAISPCEALAEAVKLGEEILARAWSADGATLTWLGFNFFPPARRQFEPLGPGFYEGLGGVAFFLAALGRVTERQDFKRAALQAFAVVRDRLGMEEPARQRWSRELGVGGLQGLGSLIYALTKAGALLGEPTLIEAAKEAARLLPVEAGAGEEKLELMHGSAGALLGLLALYDISPEPALLEKISMRAERLKTAFSVELSAENPDRRPMAGFAHGAAGICHALIRAGRAIPDRACVELGLSGLGGLEALLVAAPDEEVVFYDAPDRRLAEKMNWCQGRAGIALTLLAQGEPGAVGVNRAALNAVFSAAESAGLQSVDHVCCGNFGVVELLATAGRVLEEPEYSRRAGALARAVLQRREQSGKFNLFEEIPTPVFHPGFFQGLSGIGYTLLRLHTPELPAPLLMT